jgi:hypothetical protein
MVFQGLGFRWSQLAGMLDSSLMELYTKRFPPCEDLSGADLDVAWRRWAATETQRRVMIGHHILDAYQAATTKSMPTIKHTMNPLPSACDDRLYRAPTAAAWRQLVMERSSQLCPTLWFSDIYAALLSEGNSNRANPMDFRRLPMISALAVLEGLGSLALESKATSGQAFGSASPKDIVTALIKFEAAFLKEPESSLAFVCLLMRWHTIFLVLLGVHQWSISNGNLDHPPGWTNTSSGRRALLHANAVRQLAGNIPFKALSTIHFVVPNCLYEAGLCFAAWLQQGQQREREPKAAWYGGRGFIEYDLEDSINWQDLGTTGMSEVDTTMTDELSAAVSFTGKASPVEFVLTGGSVVLGNTNLGLQDVKFLCNMLQTMGDTWPIAARMADKLSEVLGK